MRGAMKKSSEAAMSVKSGKTKTETYCVVSLAASVLAWSIPLFGLYIIFATIAPPGAGISPASLEEVERRINQVAVATMLVLPLLVAIVSVVFSLVGFRCLRVDPSTKGKVMASLGLVVAAALIVVVSTMWIISPAYLPSNWGAPQPESERLEDACVNGQVSLDHKLQELIRLNWSLDKFLDELPDMECPEGGEYILIPGDPPHIECTKHGYYRDKMHSQ